MNTVYKRKLITLIAPVAFLMIWSGGAIFAKVGLQYTDSWSFLFLRSLIALVLLLAIYLIPKLGLVTRSQHARRTTNFKSSHKSSRLTVRNIAHIIVAGLLLQALYLTFYFCAINTGLSVGIIVLVLGIQPIITSLISISKGGLSPLNSGNSTSGKLNSSNLLLLAICFIGLVVATFGYHSVDKVNVAGIILSILALMSITFGTITQSKITTPPILTLLIQTSCSFMIFSVIIAYQGLSFEVNPYSVLSLIWMGAVVSVGAYLLLMLMLKYSAADKVSTLFFLLPLLTMVLESLVFGSQLSPLTIFGVVIVCASLFIYQSRQPIQQQIN